MVIQITMYLLVPGIEPIPSVFLGECVTHSATLVANHVNYFVKMEIKQFYLEGICSIRLRSAVQESASYHMKMVCQVSVNMCERNKLDRYINYVSTNCICQEEKIDEPKEEFVLRHPQVGLIILKIVLFERKNLVREWSYSRSYLNPKKIFMVWAQRKEKLSKSTSLTCIIHNIHM